MKKSLSEIQQALKKYELDIPSQTIQQFLEDIQDAQKHFPLSEQRALIIKLISEWDSKKEKIITITSEACHFENGTSVTTFGVLSADWPGLSDTCLGIIHEMGWNIYFVKGISLNRANENLGIILIGVMTQNKTKFKELFKQSQTILEKIHRAAIGTSGKAFLLSEEIRKLEYYSQVIAYIEEIYQGNDLEQIIGLNGEAVKYFAARSRDYIENRQVEDIARQIIRNYTFMKNVNKSGNTIKLEIINFKTMTEGIFTGVTVAGPAHLLHLEDCLKTIELTIPHFLLKHNREFTTEDGISLFRIEFVDSANHPLVELEQNRLKKAFSTMILNKRRDRAQWIESIGGFEQYARAIIPLLVREAHSTDKTQVYLSVGHSTDLFIDFKVIIVVPISRETIKNFVTKTVNHLEAEPGFHILRVKPAKTFGNTKVFIIDLRVSLLEVEDTETIYRNIKEKVNKALGSFRDFDEGMRTINTTKLKSVRRRLKGINKSLIRELYYSIEDFYRLSASDHEIIAHIRIAINMLKTMDTKDKTLHILSRQIVTSLNNGTQLPTSSLICISYPHQLSLLQNILETFEPYEVTLSRLEKSGRDILICRITMDNKALSDAERKMLVERIKKLAK